MALSESSEMKTTRFFSSPLFRQTIRSNLALTIAVLVLSCLLCFVISFAMGIMEDMMSASITTADQYILFAYLTAFAQNNVTWDQVTAAFESSDWSQLESIILTAQGDITDVSYVFDELGNPVIVDGVVQTVETYIATCAGTSTELAELMQKFMDANSLDAYVQEFEYNWALMNETGVLTGSNLSTSGVLMAMIGTMGIDMEALNTLSDSMSGLNATMMIDTMYYHEIGLLPMLIWIVVVANSVIATQVDRGSMAYVLSTPTKRSAVVTTQALYLVSVPFIMIVIVYIVKILSNLGFTGSAYAGMTAVMFLGMYILIESMCGICFFGSCFFNRSGYAMAFGGAFVVWFFIAAIVGMFGTEDMVSMGMGAEALNAFNYLTLMTLFDIESVYTVGTAAVSYSFLWKYIVLIVVAAATYVAGAVRFMRKDLPL